MPHRSNQQFPCSNSLINALRITQNLLAVFMLLKREDMLIEVFLKLLIGKINVELFKAIHFKILKSKNVKHSNKGKLVLSSPDSHVDSLQDPAKQVGIDTHRSGITRVFSLHYEEYEGVSLLCCYST